MKIFISGGCKNGKSTIAQNIAFSLKENKPIYYIATMLPVDNEDDERILRHIKDREGMGFETIEQPYNIDEVITKSNINGTYLLDSTTALLFNEMFSGEDIIEEAFLKVILNLEEVFSNVNNIVVVSDFIYNDLKIYGELTEKYAKSLAMVDKYCAKVCDTVIEVCYGNIIYHKGELNV